MCPLSSSQRISQLLAPKLYATHSSNPMKGIYTILLLLLSNLFMTFAWYGHLKFSEWNAFKKLGLAAIILISWAIALLEYCFQVPANRFGYKGNGGVFNLWQLKVIQETITLLVFTLFTLLV